MSMVFSQLSPSVVAVGLRTGWRQHHLSGWPCLGYVVLNLATQIAQTCCYTNFFPWNIPVATTRKDFQYQNTKEITFDGWQIQELADLKQKHKKGTPLS